MKFLYFLEDVRFPLLDKIMLFITNFGSSAIFLLIALVLFWCLDKKKGYYFILVGLLGTTMNQFMKLWFRVPRPWVLDERFTIVEAARGDAGGYSFPSGHSQSAVSSFAGITLLTKRRWVRTIAIILAVLVPFSRMYLGVHTPQDILVASLMAIILVLLLKPLVLDFDGRYIIWVMFGTLLVSAAYLWFAMGYRFPGDVDISNLTSGRENALSLFGAILGLPVVYIIDQKWLHFSTKAVWWAQVLKLVLGLLALLLVKSMLKTVLNNLLGEEVGRIIRYFCIVLTAGVLWPMTFGWFEKLGNKEH